MNKYCFLFVSLVLFGCKAESNQFDFEIMDSSEKAFNERQSKALVAHMSLETMFPNVQVRALAKAAGKGDVKKIEKLVSQGADVNAHGEKNATALFWAMRKDNIKGFAKLLELGADPNVVFDDSGSIIHWAAKNENYQYLKLVLDNGGNANLVAGSMFKQTPLFETIGIFGEIGNTPALRLLLDAGADVNAKRSNGDFPVLVAANFGRFDIVYELLAAGADYKVTNNNGQNLVSVIALKRAALDQSHELYRWLEKVVFWLKEKDN